MTIDWTASLGPAAFGMTPLDVLALLWFFVCMVAYSVATRHSGIGQFSLLNAIQQQRVRWFANMSRRSDRVVDVLVISNLAGGNSFFASTSIIMLGVLSALFGAGQKAQAIIERLPFAMPSPSVLWDVKIALMMTLFVYAFFKFAWAFRLGHYSMIMMGATPFPTPDNGPDCMNQAMRAARVAGLAAEHSALGLRAYYFAMAAIGWFFSPMMFIATTTLVLIIVMRREYYSRSLAAISGPAPPAAS
jgi:uncharacterized membrane protein